MNLVTHRDIFTPRATTSLLSVDGVRLAYVLEDRDRGLTSSMTAAEIARIKIPGETAIPTSPPEGYEVVWRMSPRRGYPVPWLLGVPGFEAIQAHTGNDDGDTLGCPILGLSRTSDWVGESRQAKALLYPLIEAACASPEGCRWHVTRDAAAWGGAQSAARSCVGPAGGCVQAEASVTAILTLILCAYLAACVWAVCRSAGVFRPPRRLRPERRYHRAVGGESARGEAS